MRQEVAAASGRGDETFRRLLEVEKQGITCDVLGDSGSFATLDHKLAAALMKICKESLLRNVMRVSEEETKR